MLNIAPLNYERWAVIVSPLQGQGAEHVEAQSSPRQVEQTGPVSAALSGTSSGAGETLRESDSRELEVRRNSFNRNPEHPLNRPHPTDLSLLFQLPIEILNSLRNKPTLDPRTVTGLYDRPENKRGTTVSVSG
ncbi:MAG: hypothetical protein HQ494_12135 [Rhodospirillales bacterium]|nr:hypothetical protein [Rhodospirillales bacterium]